MGTGRVEFDVWNGHWALCGWKSDAWNGIRKGAIWDFDGRKGGRLMMFGVFSGRVGLMFGIGTGNMTLGMATEIMEVRHLE